MKTLKKMKTEKFRFRYYLCEEGGQRISVFLSFSRIKLLIKLWIHFVTLFRGTGRKKIKKNHIEKGEISAVLPLDASGSLL